MTPTAPQINVSYDDFAVTLWIRWSDDPPAPILLVDTSAAALTTALGTAVHDGAHLRWDHRLTDDPDGPALTFVSDDSGLALAVTTSGGEVSIPMDVAAADALRGALAAAVHDRFKLSLDLDMLDRAADPGDVGN